MKIICKVLPIFIWMFLVITCVGAISTGQTLFIISAITSLGVIAWEIKKFIDKNSGPEEK